MSFICLSGSEPLSAFVWLFVMYIAGQYIMFCANARYCQLQYGCILQLRCTFSWSGSIKQSRVHSYLNQKRIMHPKALTQRFFINIKCYLSALSLLVASPSHFSRVFLRKATRTRLFSGVLAVLVVCVSQQRRFHSITIIISSYGLQAPVFCLRFLSRDDNRIHYCAHSHMLSLQPK